MFKVLRLRILACLAGALGGLACLHPAAALAQIPAAATAEVKGALATQLIDVTHALDLGAQMGSTIAAQFATQPPFNAHPELKAFLVETFQRDMGTFMEQSKPLMIKAYSEDFTEKELRDAIDFYSTESGQAFIKKAPKVLAETMPLVFAHLPEFQRKLVVDIFDHICEHMTCTAEDRATLEKSKVEALERLPTPPAPAR